MIKVLKREITTFNLSDNENDEESTSPSSAIISADEPELDEKTPSESSSNNIPTLEQKPVISKP